MFFKEVIAYDYRQSRAADSPIFYPRIEFSTAKHVTHRAADRRANVGKEANF